MSKKIVLFSIGIPDPGQGGSGVFNYLLCSEILKKRIGIFAFFRVSNNFLKQECENKYLNELKNKGLEFEIIKENEIPKKTFFLGSELSMKIQQYEICQKIVNENQDLIKNSDAVLSFDLGWAMALSECKKPCLCILDDPLQGRMEFGQIFNFLNPISLKRFIQLKSIKSKSFFTWLNGKLGNKNILGILSPFDGDMYRKNGINCRNIMFFSEDGGITQRPDIRNNRIIGLHLGSLATTASSNLLNYWMEQLFPVLSTLSFEIEIRFIGRFKEKIASKWDNIILNFLGHISGNLKQEFQGAHFFFSPLKYPIGVRTRIITALSYGIPVITDKASSLGLPHLKDKYDIIYASSPDEIKKALLGMKNNPETMRIIGENARKTWEELYNPEKNIAEILKIIGIN